jgi:hypothetical protein
MEMWFLINLFGTLLPGLWLGRMLRLPFALHIGLSFLVFETSLVLGAGLLSWVELLGHLHIYQIVTTLCSCGIAVGLWWITRLDVSLSPKPAHDTDCKIIGRLWLAIPIACLVIFAVCMLVLTLTAYPAVEDSLTIKLPKVVFAIESNSMLPSNLTDDPRMYISPIYPALIHLFFIINGQKGHSLLIFGFVNWMICGLAVYQLCRDVGASRFASRTATALVLLSPTLIVQGTSEGDDIIAAAPFMVSLMFLSAWLYDHRYLNAVLAGAGLGLSVGMKFLPLFFLPALPIILGLAILQFSSSQTREWPYRRTVSAFAILAAFAFVLVPQAIANWAAFGNPFYVSKAVAATRNSPFNFECVLRDLVGYTKQFLFSDFAHLLRMATNALAKFLPSVPNYATLRTYADSYDGFLLGIVPYNPTPACSAYGQPFKLTSAYITDNTLWFGVFGPLLLISSLVVVFSPNRPLMARSLALGFLTWMIAFAVLQKYLGEIGRYWAVAVLAGSPAVAIMIDPMMGRGSFVTICRSIIMAVGLFTIAFGAAVLLYNAHRSIRHTLRTDSRYVTGFAPEFRSMMKSATSVNVYLAYGIDTYDYYMLLNREAKITNKAAILDEAINVVIVRPSGLFDNPYSDPRIPVRMREPFSGGFRYIGKVLPQPGYEYSLGFANNSELSEAGKIDPRSAFLLFEAQQIKKEGEFIIGWIYHIASSAIIAKTRFRVGWREPNGELVIKGGWKRGLYAEIKVPDHATALVLQAAFDGGETNGSSEWPIRGFDPSILKDW